MRKASIALAMMLVGAVTAVTIGQQRAAPGVAVSRTGDLRAQHTEPREYEYIVLDHIPDADARASAKAEASLNRFASDGWDVLQVDWDDDLHRVAIILRREKAENVPQRTRD